MHATSLGIVFISLSLCVCVCSGVPPHRHRPLSTTHHEPPHNHNHNQNHPITYFEVSKPEVPSSSTLICSHHILSHDFANTYSQPPVTAPYSPLCPFTRFSSSIILDFSATCRGRQFDRIFAIWLDGVELLRSCTAEPTPDGIRWNVRKDITKYSSLLLSPNRTVSLYMGNIVDKTYTGVYHVNLTFHYYSHPHNNSENHNWADLILPISRNRNDNHNDNDNDNDGLWFEIQNSTDYHTKQVSIPRNAYRAVLEVYVSYHENDEFWYTNLPNDYLLANNLTAANGPFRELLLALDADLVAAISPFTVIFTGGINPLLWRPISGIGSFDLPSYDVELTPFLGTLLDGNPHSFQFSVTNAVNVWYVDANLHLWLDNKVEVLKGQLLENNVRPLTLSSKSFFKGLDGNFFTGATRSIVSKGWVQSSKGNITTVSTQDFDFINSIVLKNDASFQTVNQTIHLNTSVVSAANLGSSSPLYVLKSHKKFPLFLYTNQADQPDGTYSLLTNVTLGFDEDKTVATADNRVLSSTLRNHQEGEGTMVVKNNLVVSGVGNTHQVYRYDENSGGLCYFRNVSSYNYTITSDEVKHKCHSKAKAQAPRHSTRPLANHRIFLLL